ncbi:DUF3027 domain-containing protein [Nocardia sp. NPDC052566]|uniref:DUF3027 domain-containing protein n=1 Tax=Nocardia sp. NPDC052566 TaxID=3364330 RepID=UPI0037C6DC39
MSAVSVSESGVRPILADAVDVARRALLELEPAAVGAHLGVSAENESAATHRFEATLPGYRGWQWAVVVAAPPGADYATVSESALLPGPDALIAPDFVPWDQRVRPGDLAPGDLLAPPPNDPRLVPGYVASGDPAVDEVALEIGLGRPKVLSLEGREEAAERWYTEFGPDTDMAKAAPSTCGLCGFYLPLAGALRAAFGVCGNAMGADGRVVHTTYGCGAHSDVVAPTGGGSPLYEAYDDAAVEMIPADELRPATTEAAAAASAVAEAVVAESAEVATGTEVAEGAAVMEGVVVAESAVTAADTEVADAIRVTESAVRAEAFESGEAVAETIAVDSAVVVDVAESSSAADISGAATTNGAIAESAPAAEPIDAESQAPAVESDAEDTTGAGADAHSGSNADAAPQAAQGSGSEVRPGFESSPQS